MPKTFDNKPYRVRLGRASRGAASGGHGRVRQARVSCCQKENWNKSNGHPKILHLTRILHQALYLWGGKKFLYYCINCHLFDFSLLKDSLNQQFAPLKGLGGTAVSCINCIFLLPFFVSFC